MKKRYVVLLGLAVSIGGGIAWQLLKPPEPTRILTAKAEVVEELRSIVSATGEIQAKEFVDIQAEVAGVITEVNVEEGDTVEVGDVLLRLEDLQLRSEVDAVRAQVGSAEAEAANSEVGVATAQANLAAEKTVLASLKLELAKAKTTRDRAEASFKRKEELFQSNLIGSEEYEIAVADVQLQQQNFAYFEARIDQGLANITAAETRVDAARSVVTGAQQRVAAAKASLARAQDMFGKTVLRAPLKGLITKLNVEKGERAVPGFQSNPIATLMTIADMSVIEAQIRVAEADIVMVALGSKAIVEVDAMRDVEIAGIVTEVGQSPIQDASAASEEGKDFKVVVRLEDPPPQLRPGFTATADITTSVRDNALVIPLQAQTAREVEVDGEGRYVPAPEPKEGEEAVDLEHQGDRREFDELEGVFVMRDGRARFRPVKFGIIGDMDVEVLEGLEEGDIVVIGPSKALRTLEEWAHIAVDTEKQRESARRLRRKR